MTDDEFPHWIDRALVVLPRLLGAAFGVWVLYRFLLWLWAVMCALFPGPFC